MVTTPARRSSWVRKCGVYVAAAGASSGLIRCSAGTTTARKRVACGRHSHISICSRLPTISKALQRSSLISREYDLMDRISDIGFVLPIHRGDDPGEPAKRHQRRHHWTAALLPRRHFPTTLPFGADIARTSTNVPKWTWARHPPPTARNEAGTRSERLKSAPPRCQSLPLIGLCIVPDR